jgi:hypothetical protein
MTRAAGDPEESTACPRCGYDLRGTVATWEDSCPLSGVCTECGLELSWAEVLVPEKYEPRWCIEFEPRKRRLFRAAIATLARSFVPWRFWRDLKMSHPIRWRRLSIYLGLLVLPLVLIYVVWQATVALNVYRLVERELAAHQQGLSGVLRHLNRSLAQLQSPTADLVASYREQYGDTVAQQEMKKMAAAIQSQIVAFQKAIASPPSIEHSRSAAIAEAVFLPVCGTSSGTIRIAPTSMVAGTTFPYPSPRNLNNALSSGEPLGLATFTRAWAGAPVGGGGRVHLIFAFLRSSTLWLGLAIGFSVFMPLSLMLLPISRRRAKVRWAHIVRVFAYSAFIPVFVVLIAAACLAFSLSMGRSGAEQVREGGLAMERYGPWIGLIVWWAVAIQLYLKIPRGWLIATLHALLIFMLIIAGIYLFAPDFMLEIDREIFPSWLLGV